jgi:hypothetical protein
MSVTVETEPHNSDRWLTAWDRDNKAKLGAYMPGSAERALTVYWRGNVPAKKFFDVIETAQQELGTLRDPVPVTLIGYGKTREHVGPTKDLSQYRAPSSAFANFDAYRAELEGGPGRMVIWANVTSGPPLDFKQGNENIGVCATPAFFDGQNRQFIVSAILETTSLGKQTVIRLLDEISKALLH